MEVHFTPELQAKLDRVAEENQRGADEYVQQLVESYLDHDAWFWQKVTASLDQLDRGEFLTHEEVRAVSKRSFAPKRGSAGLPRRPPTSRTSLTIFAVAIPTSRGALGNRFTNASPRLGHSHIAADMGAVEGTRELPLPPLLSWSIGFWKTRTPWKL